MSTSRYGIILLFLCTLGGCCAFGYLTTGNDSSSTSKARPGKRLVISDSQNYGLWFEKSQSDPRYTKKRLEKNRFYHLISDPGGSPISQSIVVMHWIERDPISRDTIELLIRETDYNAHTTYGDYISSRIDPFSVGHWSDVERVSNGSEIIIKETLKLGGLEVDFYVSKDEYLVKDVSYIFPDTYLNKPVVRIFAHAFINNDNASIEIFQPVTGGPYGVDKTDMEIPLEYSKRCIEDFIVNFVEVR